MKKSFFTLKNIQNPESQITVLLNIKTNGKHSYHWVLNVENIRTWWYVIRFENDRIEDPKESSEHESKAKTPNGETVIKMGKKLGSVTQKRWE
jgi:hypothetical protein